MMRFFGFILRLALFIAVVVWLVGQPGAAHIEWHDYRIDTSAAFLLLVLIVVAFVFYELYRAWRFIKDGPRFWRLRNRIGKLEKGQAMVERGLSAIAAGDAAEAGRLAVAARRLLGTTPATRLLQAQAAQLAGDTRAAEEIFRAMAADPESVVLGYRGLIMAAVRANDWTEAERQMNALRAAKPDTPWLNLMRFELASRRHSWGEAAEALAAATSARLIEAPRARRHQAALLLASVEAEAARGDTERALHSAEKAAKLAPEWLPALLTLAQRQLEGKHNRAALRTLGKAWRIKPHPQLAELYVQAARGKNALETYKLMEKFAREAKDDPAARLALAESAMAADLWGEARRHLLALTGQSAATQQVFRLLARLERRESGDEAAASLWLMKAAEALPDPRWLCKACGGGHEAWQALCAHCGAFDTLEWRTPGVGRQGERPLLLSGALDTTG